MGTKQASRPIYRHEMFKLMESLGSSLIDLRDACLFSMAYATHAQSGILRKIEPEDLEIGSYSLIVRHQKFDRGYIAVQADHPAICPIRHLLQWLKASGIRHGALFREVNRHGQLGGPEQALAQCTCYLRVQLRIAAIGMNPAHYNMCSFRTGQNRRGAIAESIPRARVLQVTGEDAFLPPEIRVSTA